LETFRLVLHAFVESTGPISFSNNHFWIILSKVSWSVQFY